MSETGLCVHRDAVGAAGGTDGSPRRGGAEDRWITLPRSAERKPAHLAGPDGNRDGKSGTRCL